MHRFERCQSTESMIGDQRGSRKSQSVEQFWEQKVQKGQDVFFTTSITMSPASGRQPEMLSLSLKWVLHPFLGLKKKIVYR